MRHVLAALVGVLIIVGLGWFVAGIEGTVSADIAGTEVELSAPVAILSFFIAFLLLYLAVRSIIRLLNAPKNVRRRAAIQRRRDGDRAVTRTLVALAAGDTATATRSAGRARRLLGDTPQTLLLSAEAARQSGNEVRATEAFQALTHREDAAFLGYRGLLRQAMDRQDFVTAADLAKRAELANPGASWLRAQRQELAVQTGAWHDALNLADADAPKAALATAAANDAADPAQGLQLAKRAWDEEPSTASALAYARRLREGNKENRAQDVLRKAWARQPQPDLAAFALAATSDAAGRLAAAKKLASQNPAHPESALMQAEAALAANLPGEAQRYADGAANAGLDEARLWRLRAAIADHTGDEAAANDAMRHAAGVAPGASPAWHCANCGAVTEAWHPRCAVCARLGTIGWGVRPQTAALPFPAAAAAAVGSGAPILNATLDPSPAPA